MFKKRSANWVVPAIFGGIGAGYTYIWWSRKHNTHHAVPNVVDGDPDIDTMPFLVGQCVVGVCVGGGLWRGTQASVILTPIFWTRR